MPRDHRHRAEFAHRARITQNHAVEQTPLYIRQGHIPKRLPTIRAEHNRGFLLLFALRLHQWNQLARDKRKGHKHRRQHDARYGKNDFHIMRLQPRAEPTLRAEQQHINQTRHHRRDRERQVNQSREQLLTAKLKLRNRPSRRYAKHQIQRHRNRRREQG